MGSRSRQTDDIQSHVESLLVSRVRESWQSLREVVEDLLDRLLAERLTDTVLARTAVLRSRQVLRVSEDFLAEVHR
jgi:hypothetical protein